MPTAVRRYVGRGHGVGQVYLPAFGLCTRVRGGVPCRDGAVRHREWRAHGLDFRPARDCPSGALSLRDRRRRGPRPGRLLRQSPGPVEYGLQGWPYCITGAIACRRRRCRGAPKTGIVAGAPCVVPCGIREEASVRGLNGTSNLIDPVPEPDPASGPMFEWAGGLGGGWRRMTRLFDEKHVPGRSAAGAPVCDHVS